MNTTRTAAPAAANQKDMTRRGCLRLIGAVAAGVVAEGPFGLLGCAVRQPTLRLQDGRKLVLPDGRGGCSYGAQDMRDMVSALNEMLVRVVDTATYAGRGRELPFNQLSLLGMARTATDLAEDFIRQTDRAIERGLVEEEMAHVRARFEFVYAQLVLIMGLYRDGLREAGISIERIPSLLGYEMDLHGL